MIDNLGKCTNYYRSNEIRLHQLLC